MCQAVQHRRPQLLGVPFDLSPALTAGCLGPLESQCGQGGNSVRHQRIRIPSAQLHAADCLDAKPQHARGGPVCSFICIALLKVYVEGSW